MNIVPACYISSDDELELESSVKSSNDAQKREECLDMTPTIYKNGWKQELNDEDLTSINSMHSSLDSNSINEFGDSGENSLISNISDATLLKPERFTNGPFSRSSSSLWSSHSMKSRSPVPLSRSGSTGSCRQKRMFERSNLPNEEFRMAAMQGNLPVVKDIVQQKGVHVDQILKAGWTALMYSSSCGKSEVVQWLLQETADVNLHKELFTALMAACASSQSDEDSLLASVQLLLEYGAQVDAAERHRMTALMFASKEGRAIIVEKLLVAKADVDKQDNKGWSALCWAATKGHGKVVRILLQHSADPKLLNNHGQRASDIALAAGYPEIASILENLLLKENVEEENLKNLDSINDKKVSSEPVNNRISHKYGELEMVLTGLDLSHLIDLFHKHQISFEQFLRLKETELEAMGVEALGNRMTIVEAIKEIHKKDWQTSSLPSIKMITHITIPEAVAIICNINKHIRYIHTSVGYLRDEVQVSPRLLELGQEKHTVTSLSNLCGDCTKNVHGLYEEVKFFKAHLDKVGGNAEYAPSDVIVDAVDPNRAWQRRILASLVAATGVATVLWFSKPTMFNWLFNLKNPGNLVTLDL